MLHTLTNRGLRQRQKFKEFAEHNVIYLNLTYTFQKMTQCGQGILPDGYEAYWHYAEKKTKKTKDGKNYMQTDAFFVIPQYTPRMYVR